MECPVEQLVEDVKKLLKRKKLKSKITKKSLLRIPFLYNTTQIKIVVIVPQNNPHRPFRIHRKLKFNID